MINKEKYRQLCMEEKSLPIFNQDWWLDAVCGEEMWKPLLVEKGGKIIGAMPIYQKNRFGMRLILHPPLTQTLGPWIRPSATKYAKNLAYQKDVMGSLIDDLGSFDYFSHNWHWSYTNWLPFHWRGFNQTTRYTYILSGLNDEKKLWDELEEKIRTEIRKATSRFQLVVRDDLTLDDFLKLHRMTFDRQGIPLPYSEQLIKRLDHACSTRGQRKILIAVDDKRQHHAGVYIVWDSSSAYYLMGGGNPELRSSGATSLCMWEAILFSASVTKDFNFEGSMNENIERFFRGFGAKQTPYFNVSKVTSRILRTKQALRFALRG